MKMPENLTLKLVENAMRIFEDKITVPQIKALKTIVRGIFRNTTLILSHLHEHEEMDTKKSSLRNILITLAIWILLIQYKTRRLGLSREQQT
jgi:hypothetical protein